MVVDESDKDSQDSRLSADIALAEKQDIIEQEAMIEYQKSLNRDMEVLKPNYIQFHPHVFFLCLQRISVEQSKALQKYLARVKEIQDK